jgi:hypothetical protein
MGLVGDTIAGAAKEVWSSIEALPLVGRLAKAIGKYTMIAVQKFKQSAMYKAIGSFFTEERLAMIGTVAKDCLVLQNL